MPAFIELNNLTEIRRDQFSTTGATRLVARRNRHIAASITIMGISSGEAHLADLKHQGSVHGSALQHVTVYDAEIIKADDGYLIKGSGNVHLRLRMKGD